MSQTQRHVINHQYRTINVKTVSEDAMKTVLTHCSAKPNARIAWIQHPAEGETPTHFHLCASFTSPVRLAEALEYLAESDPHNYVKPCRNFRASVRYLAHLDNPEKCQLDPAQVALVGDWEGVNLRTLFERRGATVDVANVLKALAVYLDGRGWLPADRIRFAVWLDSHGYSSAKAYNMVRMMGLTWEELSSALMDFVPDDAQPDGIPAPSVAVTEGVSSRSKCKSRSRRSRRLTRSPACGTLPVPPQ